MERLAKVIQINAPALAAYDTWKRVEDFPRFLRHVRDVRRDGRGSSIWEVRTLPWRTLRWRAEITEDVPGTRLRWQSVDGDVPVRGLAEFIPAEGGCVVLVVFEYTPPFGILGSLAADLLVDVEGRLEEDLDRLRNEIELAYLPAASRDVLAPRPARRDDALVVVPAR